MVHEVLVLRVEVLRVEVLRVEVFLTVVELIEVHPSTHLAGQATLHLTQLFLHQCFMPLTPFQTPNGFQFFHSI